MAAIVGSLIGPSMKTSQWTPFYGVGGGIDFNVSTHVGIKLTSDWVYTHLFQRLAEKSAIHVGGCRHHRRSTSERTYRSKRGRVALN